MGIFSEHANQLVSNIEKNHQPIEEVDAFDFLTSSDFLNEDPLPIQRIIIKTFYNLWPLYPPDHDEQLILDILKNEWRINLDLMRTDPVKFLVLILGRRSTKSTSISFIATYEVYSLICKDNPQKYYGIRDRHQIHIMHVAAAGDQAEDVFTFTKNNIRKVPFLNNYVDFDKDSGTELRLFTPYDLRLNDKIRYENSLIPRGAGQQRKKTLPGSLTIESVTTSAATHRGKSIKCLIFSEFCHFDRAKIGGSKEDAILLENPKTDYAVWKAFTPSVKDYGKDGRVLVESSPKEKGGEGYHQYCIAGGMEQDNFESIEPDPEYALIQLSTWQSRINEEEWNRESFDGDFNKDPVGASMEYGAHFGNPAGSFIQEEWINRVPQNGIAILRINFQHHKFVISIDPGGKAKKKKADTYVVSWGHAEGNLQGQYENEENIKYWINGMKAWNSKVESLGNGKYNQIPVDPNDVLDFILLLIQDLGGKNFISEIVYDQFESSHAIATLQSLGIPAIETFFTNKYKSEMYGNYLQKLIAGQVYMFGIDLEGDIEQWRIQNKYLQRRTQGNYTFYEHPTSGPVQNDDYPDSTSNLIHRLCLLTTPTTKSVKDAHKARGYPVQIKRGPKIVKAPSLTRGGSNFGRH